MEMSSLATHFAASLLLCPLGARRLLCSFSLYLNNPSLYRSRTWYFSEAKWKNLDIHILLIVLPIAALSHVFFFLAFSENPAYRFSFLQQSLVISIFWAILILINLKENLEMCSVPENFVFLFATIAFLIEFYMSGRGLVGLGGWLYQILGCLNVLCAACCLYLSVRPTAFAVEFLLSSALVLKGTWVLQVGLSLYSDAFTLEGCSKISGLTIAKGEADIKCELDDDMWRGIALMNLVFVVHVILVITFSFLSFGLLHRHINRRPGVGNELILGSESMLIHPPPEIEIE